MYRKRLTRLLLCGAVTFVPVSLTQAQGLPEEADTLGRLFTTPGQRATLRTPVPSVSLPSPPPATSTVTPPQSQPLPQLNGVVFRHDGEHTIWLDGVAHPVAESLSPQVHIRGFRSPLNVHYLIQKMRIRRPSAVKSLPVIRIPLATSDRTSAGKRDEEMR